MRLRHALDTALHAALVLIVLLAIVRITYAYVSIYGGL